MYISLDLLFSSMALRCKGQILVALNLDVMYLYIKDWPNALPTQLAMVILFDST